MSKKSCGCYIIDDPDSDYHGCSCEGGCACHNIAPPAPAKDGMSESCQVCGGNDKDVPCAYPSEEKLGCFRDSRLNLISERERNLIAAGWNYLSNHSPENGRKLEEALAAYERKEE